MVKNKKIRLLLLLTTLWIAGLFIMLVGGRIVISLISYFLIDDFDLDLKSLIKGVGISIGCGVIIGVGQFLMSEEKLTSPTNLK